MASLELDLFRAKPLPFCNRPKDWGTGHTVTINYERIPRTPTWHASGYPLDQRYQLTALQLSNVRDNDELIPRPQATDIQEKAINLPYPTEHPFQSHIPKVAMFPKFDSPEDEKRGVTARKEQPISCEMPANAYDVTVLKKTRGFPYREECVDLVSEGKKKALYWQAEHYVNQQSKVHGNRDEIYPTPVKQLAPNLQDRPPDQKVSHRTQNVLRNIERNQWIPSYKLHYSGLGQSNPMALDNLAAKDYKFYSQGNLDDNLYPRSVNTLDPARSMEGRLRKLFAPKPAAQIMIERELKLPGENRKLTKTEIEEDQMLRGRDYVNLPHDLCDEVLMSGQDQICKPRPCPVAEDPAGLRKECIPAQNTTKSGMSDHKNYVKYLNKCKEDRYNELQEVEAKNRWKVLELNTPAHDIAQLNQKKKKLYKKEQPSTFYKHEGKYNEERGGLYMTSYDPSNLSYSMNASQINGGALFNTTNSHVEASKYPTILWDENESALNRSKTVVFKNSQLSGDRLTSDDILDAYKETVALQRQSLQPTVATADPKVQENGFISKKHEYDEHYNVPKFLQENKLEKGIRIEPADVMSYANQNLERTRLRSAPRENVAQNGRYKNVHFSDDVNIQNLPQNVPVEITESINPPLPPSGFELLHHAFGKNQKDSINYSANIERRSNPSMQLTGDLRNLAENLQPTVRVPTVVARNQEAILHPVPIDFKRNKQLNATGVSENHDEFRSLSTNFMPVGVVCGPPMASSYKSQYPVYDLGEKKDARFSWEPGSGLLRPQTCLMELQDSFIKSEIHKKFHRQFPSENVALKDSIAEGKRHSFYGRKKNNLFPASNTTLNPCRV